jgi:hypothetical protein
MRDGHPVAPQRRAEPGEVRVVRVVAEHERGAEGQPREHLPRGEVIDVPGVVQNPVARPDRIHRLAPPHSVGQRPVRHRDPLGGAGGTGRVDHRDGLLRVDRRPTPRAVAGQAVNGENRGGTVEIRGFRVQQDPWSRVPDDRRRPVGRQAGADRQIGRAGPHDAQDRRDRGRVRRRVQRAHVVPADSHSPQRGGDRAGAPVQFRVGDIAVGRAHGDALVRAQSLGDQRRHGVGPDPSRRDGHARTPRLRVISSNAANTTAMSAVSL